MRIETNPTRKIRSNIRFNLGVPTELIIAFPCKDRDEFSRWAKYLDRTIGKMEEDVSSSTDDGSRTWSFDVAGDIRVRQIKSRYNAIRGEGNNEMEVVFLIQRD